MHFLNESCTHMCTNTHSTELSISAVIIILSGILNDDFIENVNIYVHMYMCVVHVHIWVQVIHVNVNTHSQKEDVNC